LVEKHLNFRVLRVSCGGVPAVIGAASARDLFRASFADVLNEETGDGYQRPFDPRHSREFRSYIERPGAATIPLTFNLRGEAGDAWTLADDGTASALTVRLPSETFSPAMAQVDCQHRLGMMADSDISLTFQCFLGLTREQEMAVFNVINAKAKGLSSSLLDFHATKLGIGDLPLELFIAKRLNDDDASVWFSRVKLGGGNTQGVHRRVSLRGLQTATRLLLQRSPLGAAPHLSPLDKYEVVRAFWQAVAAVWPVAWSQARNHLLTKGVGVTALSLLGADIVPLLFARQETPSPEAFEGYLSRVADIDWSNTGPFKGFGGRQGAVEVHQSLRSILFAPGLAVVRTR
jgi:DNA sulfur modification protein DndB